MAERIRHDAEVEPAGEAIHLPPPAYTPVVFAAGLTIVLVGVVVNWVMFGIGLAISLVSLLRWIGQSRAETAALPISHDDH